MEYKYADTTKEIINACMEVHRITGNGFQESVYQRSLEVELNLREIKFAREVEMPLFYKNVQVGTKRVDFLINNIICVELKAVSVLDNIHLAQALNYLEAFNHEVGLLINFGSNSLEFKRLYNKKYRAISK